jgi:hypothetical protein
MEEEKKEMDEEKKGKEKVKK